MLQNWVETRPYDLVVVLILIGLLICIYKRLASGSKNKGILAAHIFLVFGLTCSLYPVYITLDPLLGGHNILNLFQRLGIGVSGWIVTRSLSRLLTTPEQNIPNPKVGSYGWLVLIVLGLVGSFIGMNADETSRGLDSYSTTTIYYLMYQIFTLLGFVIGAPYIIPRLKKQVKRLHSKYLKLQSQLFVLSYASSIICTILYVATWISTSFVPLREVFVYLTVIAFVGAFFLAVKDKEQQMF